MSSDLPMLVFIPACLQTSVWRATGTLRVRVLLCKEQHQLYDVILQTRALVGREG